jgi:hypothetical protein
MDYSGVTSGVERITPDMARQWLAYNTRNRGLKRATVKSLETAIRAGLWKLNGDAIVFSDEGVLLNGQHRLHACIAADIPIDSIVVYGIPDESFDTMDLQTPRGGNDILDIAGEKNVHVLAGILAIVGRWEKGDLGKTYRYSGFNKAEMLPILERHPGARESVNVGAMVRHGGCPTASTVCGAMHYIFSGIDTAQAERFFSRLASGSDMQIGEPVLALRSRIISDKIRNVNVSQVENIAVYIKAWNATLAWRAVKLLKFDEREGFPSISGDKRQPVAA